VEQVPEGFELREAVEVEEIQEEENRRLEIAVENREIPLTVRSERSCEGVNS
jgi:hypothetical protein